MNDAERLVERVATATGLDRAVVRAVWMREASRGEMNGLFDRCRDRVVEFATRGKQSADADLWPDTVSPVTAASQLLLWSDVPTDAHGAELLELGTRVTFSDGELQRVGTLVRSTVDTVTVLAADTLYSVSPHDVTCI